MIDFLKQLFPELYVITLIIPVTLICIFTFLYISGILKIRFQIKTNYTRKLFHILVFTIAGLIGYFYDHTAVMFYGGLTGLIIIYVIILGEGHIFYEGIAREGDNPHRSFYIGVPFICTALGGLFNSFAFGQLAIIGYFVAGWGDAIGEPVGVRFGKHKYSVLSLQSVQCQRSLEGSAAIMIMSSLAVMTGLYLIGGFGWFTIIITALIVGSITTIVEAISPHGLDNFSTQVSAVVICYGVLYYGIL
jgi:phytol kinase